MKAKKRYEKQGIGEQGDGEKLRKRRETMRGENFSNADQKKGNHEQITMKWKFDKMKANSDEKYERKKMKN